MGKYLVFGGNQFVGQGLAKRLLAEGHQVYVLNRGNRSNPHEVIELITNRNVAQNVRDAIQGL